MQHVGIIILAASRSTRPLERSFSKSAEICYKDRNSISSQNLEKPVHTRSLKEPVINICSLCILHKFTIS